MSALPQAARPTSQSRSRYGGPKRAKASKPRDPSSTRSRGGCRSFAGEGARPHRICRASKARSCPPEERPGQMPMCRGHPSMTERVRKRTMLAWFAWGQPWPGKPSPSSIQSLPLNRRARAHCVRLTQGRSGLSAVGCRGRGFLHPEGARSRLWSRPRRARRRWSAS